MGKPYTAVLPASIRKSPVVQINAGSATINLVLDPNYSHNFAGVVYYSDAEGDVVVTPTNGSALFTLRTAVQPDGYQSFANNTADATVQTQVSWASNTHEVMAVISNVVGATHARLLFTGNIS